MPVDATDADATLHITDPANRVAQSDLANDSTIKVRDRNGVEGAASLAAFRECMQDGLESGDNPEFASVQLGHESDTTLTRSAAGKLAVEDKAVPLVSTARNLTIVGPSAADRTLTLPDSDVTVTAAAATVLDDATTAAMLTTLGVTAAAQTVLDDATVDAMLETLGGTAPTGTGAIVRSVAPTISGAAAIDLKTVPGTIKVDTPTLADHAAPKWYADAISRVHVVTETVAASQFTDGGAAVGTFILGVTLPVGAILLGSRVTVETGFGEDVSCVLQVGDGTDVDRYMTGTPSIFATAANGIQTGVPSGDKLITAANTPTLTITSNADITPVVEGAGSLTVSIYYIPLPA